jgi:putative transposase
MLVAQVHVGSTPTTPTRWNGGEKNFSPLQHPQPVKHPCGTSKTIGSIVRGFKIGVTKWVRQNTAIHDIWQRNYWERIIRDEMELARLREYLQNNPTQWDLDKLNPAIY